ncbi:MAG TPA: acylphosphatase [Longimicrobiales bacterium]|nr:acylphosphatase [Longimicrobiales bacterium]
MRRETAEVLAVRVIGVVQGVGFRWWARETAQRLGLEGYVRNLPDGSVEVQATGGVDALARFELALAEGPPAARVQRLEPIDPAEALPRGEFRIER